MNPGPNQKLAPRLNLNTSSYTPNTTITSKSNQSPLHLNLTKVLMKEWAKKGIRTIHASLPGHPEPEKQGRHEPDLYGKDQTGLSHIGESKTGNGDLTSKHSREQFIDFSSRVMKSDGRTVPFHLIVPKSALPEAEKVLNELGLLNRSHVHLWYAH
ncbi:hypothetical protein HOH67_00655 [Candidatus Peregrinibacteria bacterium]|jgi:hypothetical protein|nr:hypothetical protein [Candidatus Peregrinibacteria bacterium]